MKVEEYPEVEKFIPYDPLGNVTKAQLLNMYSLVYSDIFVLFFYSIVQSLRSTAYQRICLPSVI